MNFIISIFALDDVELIADITTAIFNIGGDIFDLNQAVFHGYLTMIMTVEFEEDISEASIYDAILREGSLAIKKCSSVAVNSISNELSAIEMDSDYQQNDHYVMTVSSDNRRGLVADVAKFCIDNNARILFLSTRFFESRFVMILLLDLKELTPSSVDIFRVRIQDFAIDKELNMVLQHNEIFKATNEIKYYQ